MVRGTVVLPHGLGKSKKVLVIATGDKVKEAEAAGADFVGGEEMVEKIEKENWTDFDALIATPDVMKSVGRLGKVLGPKGLMPNPKTGTVTFDVTVPVFGLGVGLWAENLIPGGRQISSRQASAISASKSVSFPS